MFLFRLAGHLGQTVGQLLDNLAPGELEYWMAYWQLEPFGEAAEWLRHAESQAMYAESHRDTKKRRRPFRSTDFLPPFE